MTDTLARDSSRTTAKEIGPKTGALPGRGTAHAYSILAMVLVATTFPVGDMITDAIDPAVLQAIRFIIASAIFAPLVIARVGLPWPGFIGLARYSAIAGAMVVFFWTMYEGLRTTDSLNTAVLSCTIPGFTALFSAALLRERVGLYRYLALALGMIGSVWVIFRGSIERLIALEFHYGDALFLGGCVAMGLYATLVRYLHRGEPVMRMSFWVMTMAGVLFILIANIKLGTTDYGALSLGVWGGAAWLAVGASVFTFFLIQSATIKIGATRVQTYSYLIPVFVILLDWGLGRGFPPLMTLPGVAIVLLASLVIQRGVIQSAPSKHPESA
ncbi:MAG: DMT family transporter [Alphaproteobacteria bacterium]|nr:DMT family transporter [Alphaproteobacteria bacterium]